jgi:hypothetical protein
VENNIARRVLARAAVRLGGVEALARRLGIGATLARHYITGSQPVPDVLFLLALDVIVEALPPAAPAVPPAARYQPDSRGDS